MRVEIQLALQSLLLKKRTSDETTPFKINSGSCPASQFHPRSRATDTGCAQNPVLVDVAFDHFATQPWFRCPIGDPDMKIAPILVASIALAIASPAFAWELNQGAAGPALTCNFSTAEVPSQCPNKCFPE